MANIRASNTLIIFPVHVFVANQGFSSPYSPDHLTIYIQEVVLRTFATNAGLCHHDGIFE